MAEQSSWRSDRQRRDAEANEDHPRRPEDPAEPEWVLARIQQSFEAPTE